MKINYHKTYLTKLITKTNKTMKTAMQELKDKLKSYSLLIKFSPNKDGVLTIIEKDINELLEKEKEQIRDAFDYGYHCASNGTGAGFERGVEWLKQQILNQNK